MEPFANLVESIKLLTVFEKYSILGFSQGRYVSGNSKEKLGVLLFISQNIRAATSVDFLHF